MWAKAPEGFPARSTRVTKVGWAPNRSLSEPWWATALRRLREGVVRACETKERARCSMRRSQLAGKDEMADEKTTMSNQPPGSHVPRQLPPVPHNPDRAGRTGTTCPWPRSSPLANSGHGPLPLHYPFEHILIHNSLIPWPPLLHRTANSCSPPHTFMLTKLAFIATPPTTVCSMY
jgi:hypothetical protein